MAQAQAQAQAQSLPPSSTSHPTPPQNPLPNPPLASPSLISKPEHLMHKNRLQEFAQRSSLPLPLYCTVNEGPMHDPRFRSSVFVDGKQFKSAYTFSNIKAAEQDVARVALEYILQKIKEEAYPFIREDTLFCKSILNEYATKLSVPIPSYTTVQTKTSIPTFVSSLAFNGQTYVGDVGKTKKEAEQLAARAVILFLLVNTDTSKVLCEIVKGKLKLFAALNEAKESNRSQYSSAPSVTDSASPFMLLVGPPKESEAHRACRNLPMTVAQPDHSNLPIVVAQPDYSNLPMTVAQPNHSNLPITVAQTEHVFKRPKVEEPCQVLNLPVPFMHASSGQFEVGSISSKKQKKKKKKPSKQVQPNSQ